MGVPKRLTEMQQRFAEFLVFGGPEGPMTQGPKQLLAAGYSAQRELDKKALNYVILDYHHLVVKYIGQLKEERLKKT